MNQIESIPEIEIPGYQLDSCLGSGGMGRVYLAQDLRLERRVAIKLLEKSNLGDEDLNEAKIQAQINHINVVQIYDVIDLGTQVAVVMEYVEGQTLARASTTRVLSLNQKLFWLLEIAKGIEAIHRQNIIHSDLSNTNIVVTDENQIKLLDFGIAQQTSSEGLQVAKHANTLYASPEQLTQSAIDFRTDMFSFGVVAYEVLAGQHPFGTAENTDENLKRGLFISPRELCSEIPIVLETLLSQLLSVNPGDRPRSFEEVVIRLKRCLAITSQEHILEQETLPLEISDKPASLAKKFMRTPIILIVVSLIISMGYLGQKYFGEKKVDYVIVESLRFDENTSLDDTQKMQVKAAIEHAIYQYVIDHPNLRLVPESELERDKYDVQQLALNSGVSNIISSKADCQVIRCTISLSRSTSEMSNSGEINWQVNAQQTWPSQFKDSHVLALSTESNLIELFPDLSKMENENYLAGQDYEDYIAIFGEVRLLGKREPETWHSLKELVRTKPNAVSAYWLFRELSLELFYVSNEEYYLTEFSEALERSPSYYRESEIGLTDKFLVLLAADQLLDAQEILSELVELGIDNSFKHELTARLSFAQGEYEIAAENYRTSIVERESISLLNNLGLSLYYSGDIDGAKSALQKALRINSDYYPSLQLISRIYLLTEDLDEAITAFQRLIENQPNSQDLSDLSIAYMLQGDFSQGTYHAEKSLALAPNNPVQILNSADLLSFSGNLVEAETRYNKVLEITDNQKDIDSLLLQAQALTHLGKHQDAVGLINQAERISADNVEVLYTAALVYAQVGELVSASVHAKDALSQGIGALWFNIPWFKPLCKERWFTEQMDKLNAQSICII